MKQNIVLILKVAASAVILWWIFQRVDFTLILSSFATFTFGTVLLAIFLYALALSINAYKWNLLLPNFTTITLLVYTLIGQFYALVLPGQLVGEVAKAYRLGRQKTETMHTVAASVLMDRITGFAGLLLAALVGVIASAEAVPLEFTVIISLLLIACLAVLWFIRYEFFYVFLTSILSWLRSKGVLASLWNNSIRLIDAYRSYAKDAVLLVKNIALGFIFQVILIAVTAMFALELGLEVNFFDWWWIFGVVSVIVLVPITIGGIGLREGAFVGILVWLGQAPHAAVALSLSIFGMQVLFGLIGGLIELRYYLRKS